MKADARYGGYKAITTTTDLAVQDVLAKYNDLFEVEDTFRVLKAI